MPPAIKAIIPSSIIKIPIEPVTQAAMCNMCFIAFFLYKDMILESGNYIKR